MCEGYPVNCRHADVMFLGISAGRRGALVTKVPLTKDASGRLFQRCLGRLGFSMSGETSVKPDLRNCYVSNFVKGRCLDDRGNNRLPTEEEFLFWTPSVIAEIRRVKPKVVICLSILVFNKVLDLAKREGLEPQFAYAKHPSFYARHGGLAKDGAGAAAFEFMVREYRKIIQASGVETS